MSEPSRKSILIADDHESVRGITRIVLERQGFSVTEAVDGVDAVDKASHLKPDLIVLDLRMPKINGIEVATILKGRLPDTPIVLFTMYQAGPVVVSAAGISSVVRKADGINSLAECVTKLLAPKPEPFITSSPVSQSPPIAPE